MKSRRKRVAFCTVCRRRQHLKVPYAVQSGHNLAAQRDYVVDLVGDACGSAQRVGLTIEAHRIRELSPRRNALFLLEMAPHVPCVTPNRVALRAGLLGSVGAADVRSLVRGVVALVGRVFAFAARRAKSITARTTYWERREGERSSAGAAGLHSYVTSDWCTRILCYFGFSYKGLGAKNFGEWPMSASDTPPPVAS